MRKPAPKPSPAAPDMSALLARVEALEKALSAAQAENECLRVENRLLRQKVDFLAGARRACGAPANAPSVVQAAPRLPLEPEPPS
jgi:regulator of replication initiation timing